MTCGGAATVYGIDVLAVWPSRLVAVTVYVWLPTVAVSSVPDGDPAPLLSVQVAMPGASSASVQLKAIASFAPIA